MGAPTASAICTRSLRSRRPRRSSLNVEPASSWSTQEAHEATPPSEGSIEHLVRTCRCSTRHHGQFAQRNFALHPENVGNCKAQTTVTQLEFVPVVLAENAATPAEM